MRRPVPDVIADSDAAALPQHAAAEPPRPGWLRGLYAVLGAGCLVLGTIGALLPLLPTTPFVLLAGFFFARSSARWHAWLLRHRLFGNMVRDWQERGSIRRRAKWTASLMLLLVMGLSLALSLPPLWGWLLCAGCAAGILGFIWSRPDG